MTSAKLQLSLRVLCMIRFAPASVWTQQRASGNLAREGDGSEELNRTCCSGGGHTEFLSEQSNSMRYCSQYVSASQQMRRLRQPGAGITGMRLVSCPSWAARSMRAAGRVISLRFGMRMSRSARSCSARSNWGIAVTRKRPVHRAREISRKRDRWSASRSLEVGIKIDQGAHRGRCVGGAVRWSEPQENRAAAARDAGAPFRKVAGGGLRAGSSQRST